MWLTEWVKAVVCLVIIGLILAVAGLAMFTVLPVCACFLTTSGKTTFYNSFFISLHVIRQHSLSEFLFQVDIKIKVRD